ncbi:D-tyrosyl-tRNA(Tyr) deacylase [Fluviicoccus keumensis]|uniref:D-aminoacyl-tRNA deacylase n=1 Tax=Fluviicoccus keumensis TaxID=1435465 RepID=A0A4Q7Z9H3_9GAMM|nr:D-aminoacyl-tRNA deacylase [Fluviicoccus keumensis]RZU46714.1 D-tyrosyl-tRNA(Tyr) deacylase [Fluviicoccus keumensis]
MRGLIQRVSEASVTVDGKVTGEIRQGILLLLGVAHGDTAEQADKLLHRVLNYRIFPDVEGRMNRSLKDIGGGLLVVSQFTLAAETHKGLRPGFSAAAEPALAEFLYDYFLAEAIKAHPVIGAGIFGADMKVSLVNDGPVTFLLET